MAGWSTHTGPVLALPLDNVDTDQLLPARFMSVSRAEGYGDYLFHDLRRGLDGDLDPDFPLNMASASVLLAGHHFGGGSSREAAVYALIDAGFRVVAASSFGDIFYANAINNGLLPAIVSAEDLATLRRALKTADATVDLKTRSVTIGATSVPFTLDTALQAKLINGWDDIDLTKQHAEAIQTYRAGITGSWRIPKGR